jgi:hypothetical protein
MDLSSCEVCGTSGLRQTHSAVGTIAECGSCGSSFDMYYRRDGQPFNYPAAWGKCIGVYQAQEGFERPVEDRTWIIFGEDYYVFDAEGTIRRARIHARKFGDERPENVPDKVEWYHCWVVDWLGVERRTNG